MISLILYSNFTLSCRISPFMDVLLETKDNYDITIMPLETCISIHYSVLLSIVIMLSVPLIYVSVGKLNLLYDAYPLVSWKMISKVIGTMTIHFSFLSIC